MMRGFRWQLLALVITASVFALSLILRTNEAPTAATSTDTPTSTSAPEPTATATAAATTPMPTTTTASASPVSTYREALVGQVQRLNPLLAGLNPVDRDIASLIFEGLTSTNEYGEPVPALARDWVTSSDGLEYVVMLREDVLWQDGVPFNADDVIYTMSLLRSPDFSGTEALHAFWRTVETTKLGTHTVRFRLTQPLAGFLYHLNIGILPVHALEGTTAAQLDDHPFNLSPIGTGPYQLEALRSSRGSQIEAVDLRVAPVYRQRPEGQHGFALDRVRFRLYDTFDAALGALQNGDVDGLAARNRSERMPLLNVARASVYTSIDPTLGVLIFNWEEGDGIRFFGEQRVRQALMTGLNRASIIERHLGNRAVLADSPLIPGSWAYEGDVDWPTTDPETARGLLEAASIQTDVEEAAEEEASTPQATPSSVIYSFAIMVPDTSPALINVAEEVASQWSQYNLDVTTDPVDLATYQQRLDAGAFDVALAELAIGANPDVYAYWHQGQFPDGENYGSVNDRRISELLELARSDEYGINRATHYDAFQDVFIERAIAIPMYYPLYTYAVGSAIDGVQLGFIGSPEDRFRTISAWTVER